MSSKDQLFANPLEDVSGFEFNKAVAAVFPDMIQRSVPGYASVIAMSGFLAQRFAQPGSVVVDLGCSLGATTLSMANALDAVGIHCDLLAVDNSPAMLAQARDILARENVLHRVQLQEADIVDIEVANASLIALNYTLQFIAVEHRTALLKRCADGMNSGGVLILSEKIAFGDGSVNELFSDLHHDFKRSKGYSDLEISQKRAALENVLQPETLATHTQRLQQAGFSRVELWFQCLNFASLLAFK